MTREYGGNMRQRWGLIALVAVMSFFTGGWLLQRGAARDGNVYQQARLFDDVLSHVSAYYVDSIPPERPLPEGDDRPA